MKIMLDTNIILDVLLSREPNRELAEKIFKLISQEEIEACTTASSVTDIYYIVAKRLGNLAARDALKNLFNILEIIAVDGDDCIRALDLPVSDFEDALLSVCASKEGISYKVSNDKAFAQFEQKLSRVLTPDEFLRY